MLMKLFCCSTLAIYLNQVRGSEVLVFRMRGYLSETRGVGVGGAPFRLSLPLRVLCRLI